MATSSAPRVTILVPFLNGERFIKDTIESVLAQTYDAWELLLIDDGSSDGSTAIARAYARARPDKIRYIEHAGHANRGVCASRNVGIAEATGEFVALLDADDIWQPSKLEQQVDILTAHPSAAMVYGTPRRWHRWPGHGPDAKDDFNHELGVPGNSLVKPPQLLLNLLLRYITPLPSDVLVRRDVAAQIGGFDEAVFTGTFQFYEDQAFFAKLFLRADVFAADACWTWYRQHDTSCVAVVHRSGLFEEKQLLFLEWLERYLKDQRVTDRAVIDAVAKCLRPYRPTLMDRVSARIKRMARR